MNTNNAVRPLPLPASAIPDGCLPWDAEQARRWTEELPGAWVPVRVRGLFIMAAGSLALCAGMLLGLLTDARPVVGAVLALHGVWLLTRPEVVRVSVPLLVFAIPAQPALPWPVTAAVDAALAFIWAAALVRLRARTRQRTVALAAAGGVTARVPQVERPVRRGRALTWSGLVVFVPGAVLVAVAGLADQAVDRDGVTTAGVFVAGLGLTLVLSGQLGRRRAAALREAPVPVLRVLVRETADGRTEVYAADDEQALRPLFTVFTMEADGITAVEDGDDEDDEEAENLGDLLAEIDVDSEAPGPLREAVLYGTPYDGAETAVVAADEEPDEPVVVEWSMGPVRPLSDRAAGRRIGAEKRASAQDEAHAAQARVAAAGLAALPVRSWRPGWLDWLASALMVQWGVSVFWASFAEGGSAWWEQGCAFLLGLAGAYRLSVKLFWRITADRTGLWINGLRRPAHIPWEDLRSARHEGLELKVRWKGGESWAVAAPRWNWLQRKWNLTHPYARLGAELTALRDDPALRPTGESAEGERGRVLWPVVLVFAAVWVTAVAPGVNFA